MLDMYGIDDPELRRLTGSLARTTSIAPGCGAWYVPSMLFLPADGMLPAKLRDERPKL